MLHTRIIPGDRVGLLVAPRGFGGENVSALRVLSPEQGPREVLEFVRDTVEAAGPEPCPPTLVGVGIGGTVEAAAIMAKRATLYPVGRRNPDRRYAELELRTLEAVNALGIGPAGLGGTVTCLDIPWTSPPPTSPGRRWWSISAATPPGTRKSRYREVRPMRHASRLVAPSTMQR